MRKRISSLQTLPTKIIFPVLWITLFGFAPLVLFINQPNASGASVKWIFLLVWVAGTAFIYWSCIRLKAVSIDSNHLYVSNYLREISIPLSEISDVTENLWINSHPVTIHLRAFSEFGDKIVFIPKIRMFAFFSSHPVVSELMELARTSRGTVTSK